MTAAHLARVVAHFAAAPDGSVIGNETGGLARSSSHLSYCLTSFQESRRVIEEESTGKCLRQVRPEPTGVFIPPHRSASHPSPRWTSSLRSRWVVAPFRRFAPASDRRSTRVGPPDRIPRKFLDGIVTDRNWPTLYTIHNCHTPQPEGTVTDGNWFAEALNRTGNVGERMT